MEIVLTGATGKLGGELRRAWADIHEVSCVGRHEVDMRRPEGMRRHLEDASFDVLVNCAAMADVDQCERYPHEAYEINAVAPGVLARICSEHGARMVHFSTDYVLDGREPGLKDEKAPTKPVNHYGITKLEGERRVMEGNSSALVCRVSWLFRTRPPGFLESFLERARKGEPLEAADDKYSKPTYAPEIAKIIVELLDHRELSGVFHVTHDGEPQSWWSSTSRMLEIAHELGLLESPVAVAKKRMSDVARFAAERPVHTAMQPTRLARQLGWPVRDWELAARGWLAGLVD